jgi:hypothetical protein
MELTTGFTTLHRELEATGRVAHGLDRDRTVSWDVRHWQNGRLEALRLASH